jgi:transposase
MDSPNWTAYNASQVEEKRRFAELLADLCAGAPNPEQHGRGRPRLPLADMLFASVYKVYVGFSARRLTSDLRDAFVEGHIDSTPHVNYVNRYLSDPQLTDVLKELITASSLPLKAIETDFAVDSSGFSTCRNMRWFNKKYGREVDDREWVKVHLMCGVNTKIVTAVDISGWAANDTTYFISLVERTAAHFGIREVSADKAYLSRKNLNAVEAVGAMPFIPFKSNTLEPTEAGAWAKMYHLFMYKREAYMEHYHKRSNIETAYSMMKGKFGSALRSKSDTGQINEALCKVLAHNICVLIQAMHALNIHPIFRDAHINAGRATWKPAP